MRKKVVLIPIGGLCNRMRVINSAYKTFGDSRKITVVWIKNSELCAKANDFFELPSDIKVINFNLFSFPQKLIWKVVRKVIIGHPNYIHQLDFIHEQERNKEKRDIIPAQFRKDKYHCCDTTKRRFQKYRISAPAEIIQNNRNTFSVI